MISMWYTKFLTFSFIQYEHPCLYFYFYEIVAKNSHWNQIGKKIILVGQGLTKTSDFAQFSWSGIICMAG